MCVALKILSCVISRPLQMDENDNPLPANALLNASVFRFRPETDTGSCPFRKSRYVVWSWNISLEPSAPRPDMSPLLEKLVSHACSNTVTMFKHQKRITAFDPYAYKAPLLYLQLKSVPNTGNSSWDRMEIDTGSFQFRSFQCVAWRWNISLEPSAPRTDLSPLLEKLVNHACVNKVAVF